MLYVCEGLLVELNREGYFWPDRPLIGLGLTALMASSFPCRFCSFIVSIVHMVLRTIRDPPPLAGQRRWTLLTVAVSAFAAYLATFYTNWLHAYSEDSIIGKVTISKFYWKLFCFDWSLGRLSTRLLRSAYSRREARCIDSFFNNGYG